LKKKEAAVFFLST